MIAITKQYRDFPAGHRQPRHSGHCQFMHGHDWGFDITLSAPSLDECDFVLDFGKMQSVKEFLTDYFDHTFLVTKDDPMYGELFALDNRGLLRLRVVPSTSCEGLAEFVYDNVSAIVKSLTDGRVRVVSVRVLEDSKNSATFSR